MINIENLKFEYKNNFRLCIEKLFIRQGIFGIIGENGSGKTTLLNILALFDKPKAGRAEIFGENIFDIKDKISYRRKISFVFSQGYFLNDSVFNNVSLPLRLRKTSDDKKVKDILEFFKIENLSKINCRKLSSGQKHRVSLARAFVTGPEIIFLDEPFLSLDIIYKKAIIGDLKNLINIKKITCLFVSQDKMEILTLAEKIAFMKDGLILETLNADDLLKQASCNEIINFLGIEKNYDKL